MGYEMEEEEKRKRQAGQNEHRIYNSQVETTANRDFQNKMW